jgi:hypothetical protein
MKLMNVTFDESPMSMPSNRSTASGIAGSLIRYGIVKTTTGAQAILLTLVLLLVVAALMVVHKSVKSTQVDTAKNLVPVTNRH